MRKVLAPLSLFWLLGCSNATSFVRSDTTLGRVVVYRNGVAYFERYAEIDGDTLRLSVPDDKIDDFLKSLTVVDVTTGKPAPIAYPTVGSGYDGQGGNLVNMEIQLQGAKPHKLRLSYVTEAPSWKPSYRISIGKDGKTNVDAWAVVDNTSGEDWNQVKLGVGSSSALSFRFDLRTIRVVERETLQSDGFFAQAPPMGGATHGGQPGQPGKRILANLDDTKLANVSRGTGGTTSPESGLVVDGLAAGEVTVSSTSVEVIRRVPVRSFESLTAVSPGVGVQDSVPAREPAPPPPPPPPPPKTQEQIQIEQLAAKYRSNRKQIVVEGYADAKDGDKNAASLDRANRAREQLIRAGLPASQIVAVGNGMQDGRKGGVSIVESADAESQMQKTATLSPAEEASAEPIGMAHFESTVPMTVPRTTSAMVSILSTETDGGFVYFYDPESTRGNTTFPFKAVRLKNPTDSVLESGPVTVFGEGRFIGEGMSDPIPARSFAFIPFALDRQIVVERKDDEADAITRIMAVQRGVFSTEVKHTRRKTLVMTNRAQDKATVYVRHTVAKGYTLAKAPPSQERMGESYLFRVEIGPGEKVDVVIDEETPVFRTTDLRNDAGMEMVRVYLSGPAASGKLKESVGALLDLHKEMANLEQRITMTREQLAEYRQRLDELHAQIVTLKMVKSGGPLMQNLEKKMQEVSDRISKATIELVAQQEKLMLARIRFQDGVAELSL
ncbi:MAG TPA: OmpA family protein [Polyangium sp.]|nr:OmpA family protein [Polyangium sp.]